MSKKLPAVDAYIEEAPAFARPVLKRIRRAFHRGSPKIEEAIKWGVPHFVHAGIVGGMGAFQHHVAFGFWKARAMRDPAGLFAGEGKASPFAIRVVSVRELPSDDVLEAYVREAVALNEAGAKADPAGRTKRRAPRAPRDLMDALRASPGALAVWRGFAPGRRRDYVEWILEAKREETRRKRVATAAAWITEGKARNWRYERR